MVHILVQLIQEEMDMRLEHENKDSVISDAILSFKMRNSLQEIIYNMHPEEKKLSLFSFEDKSRTFWHYIPIDRVGLSIEKATRKTVNRIFELLALLLSDTGYLLVEKIMNHEMILKSIEEKDGISRWPRSNQRYWFSIYGSPEDNRVAWKFEGHHISINCLLIDHQIIITPLFWGANPANVKEGTNNGLRILSPIEDLARQLILSFNKQQLLKVLIEDNAPRDLLTTNQREIFLKKPSGIALNDMLLEQQKLFLKLINWYFNTTTKTLASSLLTNMKNSNSGSIYFAWAGGTSFGMPHYYCIQGSNMFIEYDCVQDNANHIHSVVRDSKKDFGDDILMQHRKTMH